MNFRLKNILLVWALVVAPVAYGLENTPASEGSTLLNTYEDGYKLYFNESKNKHINAAISDGLEAYNLLNCSVVGLGVAMVMIKAVGLILECQDYLDRPRQAKAREAYWDHTNRYNAAMREDAKKRETAARP